MVNAIIQRVYNYLLVNRARKYIDPFYHSTGNEIGFVLIGNVISVSGHAKVDGLSNLEISGKMRVDERRIRKPRYILVTNENDCEHCLPDSDSLWDTDHGGRNRVKAKVIDQF